MISFRRTLMYLAVLRNPLAALLLWKWIGPIIGLIKDEEREKPISLNLRPDRHQPLTSRSTLRGDDHDK